MIELRDDIGLVGEELNDEVGAGPVIDGSSGSTVLLKLELEREPESEISALVR